jgi:hypothetical protein
MNERTRRIKAICPHCENEICIEIFPRLDGIYKTEEATENSKYLSWRGRLTKAEVAMLESAKMTGIFKPMLAAMEKSAAPVPKNQEKFFLEFMRLAAPITIPASSLELLINEFHGRIEVLQFQQLVAVLSDNQLVMFAPLVYVGPSKNGKRDMRIAIPYETATREWLKTRNGYVPMGARIFGQQIRGKQFGDFGHLVL